ncbi:MAG: DedA family protein [Candidatus Ancillula sp.]|jgi:membrane protein DedA with SNARE-associated domain|nr:DedA family protein [Candidatus Ancillula sp.]
MINLALEACESTGIIGDLVALALNIIGAAGYFGAILVVMVENVLPFIPSEVILPALGMAASQAEFGSTGVLAMFLIIVAVTFASALGAAVLFGMCRLFGEERVKKLPFIDEKHVDQANEWFVKRGDFAVFICRFVPVVRVLITVPAGLSTMKFSRFICFTTLGSLVWNTVFILIGGAVGSAWCDIEPVVSKYLHVTAAVFIIMFALALFLKYKVFAPKVSPSDNADTDSKVGE